MDNYKIKTFNKIAKCGLDNFNDNYQVDDQLNDYQGILVRSANLLDVPLSNDLLAIARAGAGTNNIPIAKCSETGIVVFNTPGANANAVKELVLAAMIIGFRKIASALLWSNTLQGEDIEQQVESGKSQFVGHEIYGKKLGVIGLGAIGVLVANSALDLGMEVYGYDPYITIKAAWNLAKNVQHCKSIDEILSTCDVISIHIPYSSKTKDLIDVPQLAKLQKHTIILNFSRAGLVNQSSLIEALANDQLALYLTDFPSKELLHNPKIIALPHLGASTDESEDNCALMAVNQLKDYLENGNITNAVNLPNINLERSMGTRITLFHLNVPTMIAQISNNLSSLNIINLTNKSQDNYAYTIVDIDGVCDDVIKKSLEAIPGILRIRIIT